MCVDVRCGIEGLLLPRLAAKSSPDVCVEAVQNCHQKPLSSSGIEAGAAEPKVHCPAESSPLPEPELARVHSLSGTGEASSCL